MAVRGLGGRERCGVAGSIVHSGRRLMCRSSASGVVGMLALDGADGAALAGCQSDPVIASFRGGADTAGASGSWASTALGAAARLVASSPYAVGCGVSI